MTSRDETYIVRVRGDEGDAVVEEVRSRRRVYVRDLAAAAALIASRFRTAAGTQRRDDRRPGPEEEAR